MATRVYVLNWGGLKDFKKTWTNFWPKHNKPVLIVALERKIFPENKGLEVREGQKKLWIFSDTPQFLFIIPQFLHGLWENLKEFG